MKQYSWGNIKDCTVPPLDAYSLWKELFNKKCRTKEEEEEMAALSNAVRCHPQSPHYLRVEISKQEEQQEKQLYGVIDDVGNLTVQALQQRWAKVRMLSKDNRVLRIERQKLRHEILDRKNVPVKIKKEVLLEILKEEQGNLVSYESQISDIKGETRWDQTMENSKEEVLLTLARHKSSSEEEIKRIQSMLNGTLPISRKGIYTEGDNDLYGVQSIFEAEALYREAVNADSAIQNSDKTQLIQQSMSRTMQTAIEIARKRAQD